MAKRPEHKEEKTRTAGKKREDFLAWYQMLFDSDKLRTLFRKHGPRRGPKSKKLSVSALLMGLCWHFLSGPGTLAAHIAMLLDLVISESNLSQRRQALKPELISGWLRLGLKPLADKIKHPQSFWKGLRLVAVDGTQFSGSNTPGVVRQFGKALSRRYEAAFAKVPAVVMVELGVHNPLALEMGMEGESELELAKRLLPQLPQGSLLLADRLYGTQATVAAVKAECERKGGHLLIRVRKNLKGKVVKRFEDGSEILEIEVGDTGKRQGKNKRGKGKRQGKKQSIQVRQVRVRVSRPGRKAEELRLWTNLSVEQGSALELAQLYAQRWQQEVYYRNVKLHLRGSELLQSGTVQTCGQELAALVIASALVARMRVECAGEEPEMPVLNISFVKLLGLVRTLWTTLALGHDLLSEKQIKALYERFWKVALLQCTKRSKKGRSYPRQVRQPVKAWPRKIQNEFHQGQIHFELLASSSQKP
jgi:hypothetical protein